MYVTGSVAEEMTAETPARERKEFYVVPQENFGRLTSDVERLNKRARRLKLPPITVTVLSTEERPVTKAGHETGFVRTWYTVKIDGATPVLNGWTFVASLSHVEGQVITTTQEGRTLPEWAKSATPENCDHCHTRRDRLTTFVLQHEDGRTAQVGRNCLADFIRTTDPFDLAAQAEFLLSLDFGGYEDEPEGGSGGGRRGHRRVNAVDFTAFVLRAMAAQGGFVSKAKGNWSDKAPLSEQPTAKVADDMMSSTAPSGGPLTNDERESAWEYTSEVLKTVGAMDAPSEYEQNLLTVAGMAYLDERLWGIAASLPAYVQRKRQRESIVKAQAEAKSHLEWVGTVGKRETFTLTMHGPVKWVGSPDGPYGQTALYKFTDPNGNEVTYFSSRALNVRPSGTHMVTRNKRVTPDDPWSPFVWACGAPHDDKPHNKYPVDPSRPPCDYATETVEEPLPERPMMDGDTVTMKATVKKHEEFRGVKQTVVTRGTIQSLVSEAPGGGK